MVTLASDVAVLGAAVGMSAVGLKAIGAKYKNALPAPIKAKLADSKQVDNEDDDVI